MDKKTITILGAIGIILLFGLMLVGWFVSIYNGLITLDNTVDERWAQVENQYQRRADLIPNLVNVVKGYAAHEKELFTEITALRSQWADAKASGDIDAEITAARGMDSAISRLLLVVENYPDLKANENFLALQSQLEGTENRIAVERMRYNTIVREYNIRIKKIPDSFVANMLGYEERSYFEADEGADVVPVVEF